MIFDLITFRLRKCSELTYRTELLGGCSIIRELHVYGSVVPVSGRDDKKFQHQGFGTLLMNWAEDIAIKEHGSVKMAVISGNSLILFQLIFIINLFMEQNNESPGHFLLYDCNKL